MILLLSFNWERTSLAFLKGGEAKVTEQCHFLGIRKHTVNRPLGRPQTRWHLGGIMPLSPSACHPSPLAERHPRRRCRHAPVARSVHRRAAVTGSAPCREACRPS